MQIFMYMKTIAFAQSEVGAGMITGPLLAERGPAEGNE
jgi:hypothetical protein